MKNVIKRAEKMEAAFEWKKRSNGDKFLKLKDGSPAWMTDVIHKAHEDRFPDDGIYEMVYNAIAAIAELDDNVDEDEITESLYEIEPDVYTSDLTKWLASHNGNVYYLTEAMEQTDIKDGFQLLGIAQKIQIDEISNAVFNALKELGE